MADASTETGGTSAPTPGSSGAGTGVTRRETGGLQTDKGRTTIADPVVTKVAGLAAREVGGVYQLGGGVSRALGAVTQRLPGQDSSTQGVSVEVGEKEAAVDLTVVVEYGESIPRVAQQIRENVVRRIEGITGLSVTEVNVAVNDLHLPSDDQDDEPSRVQ
ncbi:MAG: Asp23/Gls24 family envelope stress response protein [Actinomycetota bacterium]|nr:Asp23/Gls24 family envelope stress response protein [Actinomycetota bacterium]